MEEGKQYSEYLVERNPRSYMSMRDYRNLPWQWQQPVERNPNPPGSMSDYRDQWMSAPSYMMPPQYTSTPQPPQPPQLISPVEQAILNLTKLVGDVVVEQKEFNAQLSQKIHAVENPLEQKLDGFQCKIGQQFDSLQCSISKLAEQLDQKREESQEEECLRGTMVGEPCLQQPQEGLVENFESSVGAAVCLWEKKEATSPLLTKDSSGQKTVEGTQEPNIQPIPMKLNPSATAQATKCPLPVAPSTNQVYIMPTHAPPSPKAKSNPSLPAMQNFKRLVASVQNFATTSKT